MNRSVANEAVGTTDMPATNTALPLLEPDDSPPYHRHNENTASQVLLVADHASAYIPSSLQQLGLEDWVLERHVAWDIGSDLLARYLSDMLQAPAILAGFSRLVVDPNRQYDDPTAFIEVSDGIPIPGNQGLDETEKQRRANMLARPYHRAIAEHLQQIRLQGRVPALISVHTCTPVFGQVERPWHIGVMWDKDPRLAVPLIERLSQMPGVCVGDNEPYSGRDTHDYTIDHHAEAAGLPHVAIEVRQDLVGDRQGARHWAAVLAHALQDILADNALYQLWGQHPGNSPAHKPVIE